MGGLSSLFLFAHAETAVMRLVDFLKLLEHMAFPQNTHLYGDSEFFSSFLSSGIGKCVTKDGVVFVLQEEDGGQNEAD